jgi:hypothetical protein
MRAAWAEPRRRGFVVLALVVLALHAMLLGGIDAVDPGVGTTLPGAVQVRALPAEIAPAAVSESPAPATPTTLPAATPRSKPRVPRVPRTSAEPVPPVGIEPAPPLAVEVAASQVTPDALAAAPAAIAGVAEPGPEPAASEPPLPTYRTRLPPAATLQYDLQRGRFGGSGELRWSPEGERYELRLTGSVVGINVLTQLSQGGIDGAGLAPQRFTDQRARRAAQAANFDRATGRLSFSGPSTVLPLHAGVQDRLSWMVQLAAIVAADPRWLEPDARIVLQVVGARGDAGLWVFRCVGAEPLDTAAGRIDSVHFAREPRGPYDTGVDVWLDPARHHLPVRATIRSGGDGEGLELRLREAVIGG